MTTHMTQVPAFLGHSVALTCPVCGDRMELLDRLAGSLERLRCATHQFQNGFDANDSMDEPSVCEEILRLRRQCGNIRLELECHRASHGC